MSFFKYQCTWLRGVWFRAASAVVAVADLPAIRMPDACAVVGAVSRKQTKRILLLTAFALTSSIAMAAGPGWTENSTVDKLVVTAEGGMNILLSPRLTGCVSLSGYGSAFAWVHPNHPGFNRIKADLMLAYAMNKPVALYMGDNQCQVVESMLGGW